MKVKIRRGEGLSFMGIGDSKHYIMMDTDSAFGGTEGASKPKELFLMGLAGCTGMDVASILDKMRVSVDRFEVAVDADMAEEHPKVFTKIRLEYLFRGENIDEEKVAHAIELSETKYCAVTAMLRPTVLIETRFSINPEE